MTTTTTTTTTTALPTINPEYGRTALGAHLFGVIDDPVEDLPRITTALLEHRVELDDIAVYGQHRALGAFEPGIRATHRPQPTRIMHVFGTRARLLDHYRLALETGHAILSVRIDTFRRHDIETLLRREGVREIAFSSARRHRRPADDLDAGGNATFEKRRVVTE